ncbi:MAG: DUF6134 family protein [Pseudomonadota bacterium]
MRRALILTVGLVFNAFAIAETAPADQTPTLETIPVWQPEGGEAIRFEVLRKGKPFGTHFLNFEMDEAGDLTVVNDIDLTVKIGPITAYKYRHDSVETWRDGRLISLEGQTRKEGDDLAVEARMDGKALQIDGTNYSGSLSPDIIPSSHWNITQIFSDAILSSEGGQVLDIVVEDLGSDSVLVAGQEISATKFLLKSDLDVYLWYDEEGRWLKCAFSARGQDIEYVLENLY